MLREIRQPLGTSIEAPSFLWTGDYYALTTKLTESKIKERIQHQYDALAKKTLVGEAKSYRRTLAKRASRQKANGSSTSNLYTVI